jgi:hypothetical protein
MAIEKKKVTNKSYTILKEIGPNDKCAPQARLIVDTIKANGGTMTREALLAALKRPVEQGGLKTGQTHERILGFYKPKLADMGVMREISEEKEIEVEVPDKPAKEAAPAKEAKAPKAPGEGEKGKKGEPKTADAAPAVKVPEAKAESKSANAGTQHSQGHAGRPA